MKNIILIGFMGSGKTSAGISLSYRLRRTMVDTDKEIERLYHMRIPDFRKMETGYLEKLLRGSGGKIISTGGGLPMREDNRELLTKLGTVIYLRVRPETVCSRLAGDTSRPLLQGEEKEEKVKRLLEMRAPVYESAADIVIDTDEKTTDGIVDEILERIGGWR